MTRRWQPPAGTDSSSLTAARRATELDRATAPGAVADVVVIGGGITGVGAALDAASRGLSTVLIEAHDLGFGTSRWSSKLAHGGLRYLATGDVAVAHESAVERGRLLTHIAPHLVRGEPMMLPLLDVVSGKRAALMGAGFFAGDLLRRAARTPRRELPPPRRISASRARELAPGLPTRGLRGALLMHDGQLTDDARLVAAVARTAASHGASVLTRVRATGIGPEGVAITDELTGASATLATRAVINATGIWASTLTPELHLRPSRGTHVVLDGAAMPGLKASLTLPYPGERNRYLLLLPQLDGRLYLGLTDEAVDAIEEVPAPQQWEIDEMVGALGQMLGVPVDPAHVLGAFAGLRPLVAPPEQEGAEEQTATADLSRQHTVMRGEHHAVHVVGGKLTTYRRMAEDAVDAAIDHAGLGATTCRTRTLALVGAAPRPQLAQLAAPALMVARFGTEAPAVQALAEAQPDLAGFVAPGGQVTGAELLYSALHEGVHAAEDLLDRRFRLGLVARDREAALPAAEAAIAAARERAGAA